MLSAVRYVCLDDHNALKLELFAWKDHNALKLELIAWKGHYALK
jgi:hypothetical protein